MTRIKLVILKHFSASPPLFQKAFISIYTSFLRCFYGSRGRLTTFLHYQLKKHS
ncbi:hypothetical protein E2C01_022166 [Portunus trituberculatus]|uniref:Uncharacterized protein n=1 Tax=Portunus trituberculatus TaxID=210409 RepID=A0A5B7E4N1_PORTR|nr:hypothetical protein [Portunus trituberculatus]